MRVCGLMRVRCSHLFAFHNREKLANAAQQDSAGFTLYSPEREFKRLQLPSAQWRISNVNRNFAFPQFPNQFIVPAAINDAIFASIDA